MGGSFFLLLFLAFLIVLTVAIAAVGWWFKKPKIGYLILMLWGGLFILGLTSYLGNMIRAKKILDKDDFYGDYTIDRDFFSGEQVDWQYTNFRFKITEKDSIYFYVTDGQKINDTYKGSISTVRPYESARLVIKMEKPNHHILTTNPTIYRESWGFFMVFNSPKFSNMYFRKGTWKPINLPFN